MEFLKDTFGTEALTYDQLAEKLKGNDKIKLANLATGEYVSKSKYDTLELAKGELQTQLATANTKLEGYDPEWKVKAEQAEKDAQTKISAMQFDLSLDAALSAAKARSPKAVKAMLNMDGLKLNDGQIIGLNEQLETVKKEHDYLFESDKQQPVITKPGSPPPSKGNEKEYLDTFYKGNPFYK